MTHSKAGNAFKSQRNCAWKLMSRRWLTCVLKMYRFPQTSLDVYLSLFRGCTLPAPRTRASRSTRSDATPLCPPTRPLFLEALVSSNVTVSENYDESLLHILDAMVPQYRPSLAQQRHSGHNRTLQAGIERLALAFGVMRTELE